MTKTKELKRELCQLFKTFKRSYKIYIDKNNEQL